MFARTLSSARGSASFFGVRNLHGSAPALKKREVVATDALVKLVAKDTGVTQVDAKAVLSALPEIIKKTVKSGKSVRIQNLATFELQQLQPRVMHNVKTKEKVQIPARNVLKARALPFLRNINK